MAPFGGDAAHAGGFAAVSAHYTDGPFVSPQGYRHLNGFAKFTAPVRNEAQFATTSRLRDETSEVTELNFTPGAGRSLQLGVGYRF